MRVSALAGTRSARSLFRMRYREGKREERKSQPRATCNGILNFEHSNDTTSVVSEILDFVYIITSA